MPKDEIVSSAVLKALVVGRVDLISRIAAPLWARVGEPLDAAKLSWVRPLLGENGPEILLQSLVQHDALHEDRRALDARGLSRFLSWLLGMPDGTTFQPQPHELVWTLPNSHPAHSVKGHTYLESCVRVINDTRSALTLVSPFIDFAGMGTLSMPMLGALSRGVEVRLFTHDALNLGTATSRALEELRREAERSKADLAVFSAEAGAGRDRLINPFFHAKLVVADERYLLLGSANLTSYALGSNFEAGVLLGESAAKEALLVLDGILKAKSVYLVFRTGLRV